MFADKLVVWNVSSERANEIVAVLKCIGCVIVEFMPSRFCVADNVQPVSSPSLTKVRGFKQLVDNVFSRLRVFVLDKCFDFIGCQEKGSKVEVQAAKNCCSYSMPSWVNERLLA